MSKFVKEEEVVTIKRVLVEQEDACGPEYINMSVKNDGPQNIMLVIGANWVDRTGCYLSKKGLAELIEELKLIHEAI